VTPTVFGPDLLAAALAADFAVRGVDVEVLVGEWETERHYGAPRIVVGEDTGSYDDPAGMRYGASGWIDVGNGQVARARLARVQKFPIWVHAVAPDDTAPGDVAQAAREATTALLDRTATAIARTRGGLPILPWPVTPFNEARGDFVYGSIRRFDATIAIFALDDPSDTLTADDARGAHQMDVDGTLVPATAETTTTE